MSLARSFIFRQRVLEMPAVVFVVAGDVDHGPAEVLDRPPHPARLQVDVARQDHHIGAHVRRLERGELEVQVGEDVQAHGQA